MSKRVADTQLTKDGALSDGEGFSDGSQMGGPRRATAAQMAARKLAKPRGGRRPGTPGHTRPAPAASQPQQSPFQFNNSSNANGTQQHQNPFSSLNGNTVNPPNNTSQSFPPFGGNSNSSFNTQFTAPSSSEFNFSAGSGEPINNPFAKHVPQDREGGFQGSIFNVPATRINHESWVKDREALEEPKFAAHSPFHNGNQDSTPNLEGSSENSLTMSANQQKPGQIGSGLFSQSTSQEGSSNPAANSVFSQAAAPQQQTTNNIFGNLQAQPQSQPSPSNIFGSAFSQPKPTQPTQNFFAHLGSPKPSASLGQPLNSPAQEDQSMMSTSPDTSPSSRPFGFLNGTNNQSPSEPTNDTPSSAAGTSLFDRVSKPIPEANSPALQNSRKENNIAGLGASFFGPVSKPAPEAGVPASMGTTSQASSQKESSNLFGHIAKPPSESGPQSPFTSENGNPFKIQPNSSTSPIPPTNSGASPPQKKKLFGHSLFPQAAQPASTTPDSSSPPVNGQVISKAGSKAADGSSEVAKQTIKAPSNNKRKLDTPPQAPSDFSAEEKRQLVTGYRLRHFDECMRKRLRTKPPESEILQLKDFYEARVASIRRADGGPLETIEEMVSFGNKKPVEKIPKEKAKRKANEDLPEETVKKPRKGSWAASLDSVTKNAISPPNSQTSNLFKNIVDTKDDQGIANGSMDGKIVFAPSRLQVKPSTMPPPPKPTSSNLFAQQKQADTRTPDTVPPASSIPQSFGAIKASTSGSPASSTINSATIATASSDTPKAPPFQLPKIGSNATSNSGSSSPFTIKPTTSGETSSSMAKDASNFRAPTAPMFASKTPSAPAAPNPFLSKSATNEDASADAPEAPAFKVPTFVPAPKSATNENTSADAPKAPAFKVPTFGAGTTTNFMAQFGKAADKVADEAKKKRKAEDYDSEEEDEAAWDRRYDEEQRAKKQKLEEASKAGAPRFVNGKLEWNGATSGDPASAASPETKSESPVPSIFEQPIKPMASHHNIFGHLSGSDSGAEGSKTGDADDEDDGAEHEEETERLDDYEEEEDDDEDTGGFRPSSDVSSETSDDDDEGRVSNEIDRKATGSQLPKFADLHRNVPSPSLFDRITKDDKGNPVREVPKSEEKSASQKSGIFGQGASFKPTSSGFATSNSFGRPEAETSNNAADKASSTGEKDVSRQSSSSPLGSAAPGKLPSSNSPSDPNKAGESPAEDRTWKVDTPIKFGTQSDTPAVNITAPSPSKPYSGLFGAPKTNATADSPAAPLFSFTNLPPAKPTNTSLGFNFTPAKPATNALAASSNTASGGTSRPTSPGVTTGESANESNPDHNENDAPPEAQLDLVSEGPGEESEDTIFKVRAKAWTWDAKKKDWIVRGLGPLRVLQHRETNATRILLRHDPSGRIVINTNLLKDLDYENPQDKTMFIPVVEETGDVVRYMVKVGKEEDAEDLTCILMRNRPS